MVWMSNNKRGTELTLGEFETGLEPAAKDAEAGLAADREALGQRTRGQKRELHEGTSPT